MRPEQPTKGLAARKTLEHLRAARGREVKVSKGGWRIEEKLGERISSIDVEVALRRDKPRKRKLLAVFAPGKFGRVGDDRGVGNHGDEDQSNQKVVHEKNPISNAASAPRTIRR
jgi:hypothetical protein